MIRQILDWLAAAVLLIFLAYNAEPQAAPLAIAKDDTGTVTLTDERCALPEILNLPKRATLVDAKGRRLEMCYGVKWDVLVVLYRSDKRIGAMLLGEFQPVTGL